MNIYGEGFQSTLCSKNCNMLELFLELLWSKTLSAPSVHARALKDFVTSIKSSAIQVAQLHLSKPLYA